jgi:mannose-6-phosphate isomerase
MTNCGESWELSGVEASESLVTNGFLAGNTISELVDIYMGELVGERVFDAYGIEFPLLVKLLDTNSYLSIQVHPDDAFALKHHDSLGKTEMWIVLDAQPGAEIIVGFNRDVTPEIYKEHLESGRLKEILNVEQAQKGDVYFIPAGRIHAIGAGITLLEIQQTSDITYRVYDWDRMDEKGLSRELHTEQALKVLDFKKHDSYKTNYSPASDTAVILAKSPFFTTRLIELTREMEMDYNLIDSFVIYCCIEGTCMIQYGDGLEMMQAGDTVLIPAELKSFSVLPTGRCKIVETYIG